MALMLVFVQNSVTIQIKSNESKCAKRQRNPLQAFFSRSKCPLVFAVAFSRLVQQEEDNVI